MRKQGEERLEGRKREEYEYNSHLAVMMGTVLPVDQDLR